MAKVGIVFIFFVYDQKKAPEIIQGVINSFTLDNYLVPGVLSVSKPGCPSGNPFSFWNLTSADLVARTIELSEPDGPTSNLLDVKTKMRILFFHNAKVKAFKL